MRKQEGRILIEKTYKGDFKSSDIKAEIPYISENDSLVSYFDKILAVAGIKPEPHLKMVEMSLFLSGYIIDLLVDASAINDSTASPVAMLFVTEDEWTGIYARVKEAKYIDASQDPNSQKLKLLHGTEVIGGLQNVAGQVVTLPKKLLVHDSGIMIFGSMTYEYLRVMLDLISPSGPILPHLITPETIARATVISKWTDTNVGEKRAKRVLVAAKEIGAAARMIQEIDKKAQTQRQVVGAVGKVAESLYPAANLRGIFQIHQTDYGAILQVTGDEGGSVVDLRFSDPNRVGLFISGKGVTRNRDFFEYVAGHMYQPLLLYNPESGNSLFFERHRETDYRKKQGGHAIPINDIFACVAFYRLGAPQRKPHAP